MRTIVPQSMTGFGGASASLDTATLDIEIRTLNHRFLEVFVHLAPELPREWELICRQRIEHRLARGRVDVYVEARRPPEERRTPYVDTSLAEAYHIALKELADTRGLAVDLDLMDVANLPGVLELRESDPDLASAEGLFSDTLDEALEGVIQMRQREGEVLKGVMGDLLEAFSRSLTTIEERLPELEASRYELVLDRVQRLLGDSGAEFPDVAGEVALMAQRVSVAEEVERLRSHIGQATEILDSSEPIGRRLDFVIGEMGRESNTVAAKIADAELNRVALDMKGCLEDMREQARNIE